MAKRLNIWFDPAGDYLEFSIGNSRKGFFEELGNDIIQRVDVKTRDIIGFGIINFSKHFKKPAEEALPLPIEIKMKRVE